MKPEQDLAYVTTAVLQGVQRGARRPSGRTGCWCTATPRRRWRPTLAAFYAGIRIGHVEAGLRTGDLKQPWPEEMNRSLVDRVADLLFAPTDSARDNLLRENLPADRIVVTGNTVVDALLIVREALAHDAGLRQQAASGFGFLDASKRLILVTGHRRESFGRGFEQICEGLRRIAQRDDVQIVYPVHLNPAVQAPVRRLLGDLPNVHLLGAARLRAVRLPDDPEPSDPDRFRRHPGGSAVARQAGAGDAAK